MSFHRRMTRPDATQTEIVEGLRKAGVQVWIIGQPCDLLTLYRGRWQPLECKPVKKRNRKDQERQSEFLATTGTPVVRTAADAIAAITMRGNSDFASISLMWDEAAKVCQNNARLERALRNKLGDL